MTLILDEITHRYTLDGKPLDGVTETIKAAGLMPSYEPQDLEWYLERGKAIHRATELYDKGILEESTVDERIKGYLWSWKQANMLYPAASVEIQMADKVYGYAGTIDRINPLCDIKSGSPEKWHKIQLGAYWGLCKANGIDLNFYRKPIAVYLQEDGSMPKIVCYKIQDMQDALKIFLSALVVVRWKREYAKN